uniref:SH3 domain containing protein n=1 Tax=Coptotermes formosanus TaxID=36987 RepID=R4UXE5_COPFO|nr:SH3 domain containing protein [Coptotermes formosanus]
MQKKGLEFAKHCLDFYIEGNKLVKQFGMKMQKFDANDRSQRFLRGAFDPTPKAENFEEQDVFAYAIADFGSEEPLDLQFLRGDKIKVLLQHTSGWWEGDLNGNKGYFPRSFVQVAGAVEVKNEPIGAVFLCVHDQKGSRSGELALLDGDLVLVDFIVKDKCTGTNLRTSLRGTFPLSLLDSRMT